MILQALYAYNQILINEGQESIPRPEYSSADASFEVHMDKGGEIREILPYVNEKGKTVRRSFNVPKQAKRSSGIAPYYLCDKPEYLFGAALSMREACREALVELWTDVLQFASEQTPETVAIRQLLERNAAQLAEQLNSIADEELLTAMRAGGLCVLKYVPTGRYMHEDQVLQQAWERYFTNKNNEASEEGEQGLQMCLITGEEVPSSQIARLHPSIKNVVGAQSSGAAIVSFNIPSFCSYGREQSYNAPTSQQAADAYGFVLNKLLADDRHRVRMNDTTIVFWAQSSALGEQELVSALFQEVADEEDSEADPESVRSRVKSAVNRIRNGQEFRDTFADLDSDIQFYVLGLSPNAARLSVRFWHTGTLGELGERVWQHYKDLAIVGLDRTPTIRQLLRELAVAHDWKNIPPNMEGQLLRSVLQGQPYSRAIFAQLINRIRSDQDDPRKGLYKIGAVRAALIKAFLSREARARKNQHMEEEWTMAENTESTSVPYNLGRLFACLEKAQQGALGQNINATIKDRFWGAASSTPALVFPRLLHLVQHHISKDEEWGRSSDWNISEVMNRLPENFPKRLSLEEQGMFALGYYHKRQSLYTKKTDKSID